MRNIFLIALSVLSIQVTAQQFYFPKENYKDSLNLANAIPSLVAQIMPFYKEDNKIKYYDDMLRYALVAKQYNNALSDLALERHASAPGDALHAQSIGFPFELYAKAKLHQQTHNAAFADAFKAVFLADYNKLAPQGRIQSVYYSSIFSGPPVPVMQTMLYALIDRSSCS